MWLHSANSSSSSSLSHSLFLSAMVTLFDAQVLLQCQESSLDVEAALEASKAKAVWMGSTSLDKLTSPPEEGDEGKSEDGDNSSANVLVLCPMSCVPNNFSFLHVPKHLTFLLERNTEDFRPVSYTHLTLPTKA